MRHFINLKDIPSHDLKKIILDAKKRKTARKKLNHLEIDKGAPLKGKLLIQMFEKSSLRTRLSFFLAISQLAGRTLTLRRDELHLSEGGESIEDTAKILSNFGDAFMLRTDSDEKLEEFKKYLRKVRAMGIDMETATVFITGFANEINRGALLLVSDTQMTPEGVKTKEKDAEVTRKYVDLHLKMGIEAMTRIGDEGEKIKHFKY